jgi:hypothetical protein
LGIILFWVQSSKKVFKYNLVFILIFTKENRL